MLDVVVRAQAGIESGTDVPGTVRFRLGGSAANTARAFAGLGGAAAFVGTRGQDELGRRLVAALRASGVTVHAVARRGVTPRLAAIVEPSGQRSFVTDRCGRRRPSRRGRQASLVPAVPTSCTCRRIRSSAARSAPPRWSARRAMRQRGALVSVDLASRRPLVDAGRAAVRSAARARSHRTSCSPTPTRPPPWSARAGTLSCSSSRRSS